MERIKRRPVPTVVKTSSRDTETENDSNSPPAAKSWPGPWGRIGGQAGTAIILGTLLQLGTFGFLIFLWVGRGLDPDGAKAPPVWRKIFLSGAGTRVVTVCALIIRSIVGLQATVCTGLAAALVLEARKVDMSNAAAFSVLRAVNGGPISFVTPLAKTPARLFTSVPAVLILILWLVSTAISFSSTILLSDFRTISLVLQSSNTHVPVIEASSELVGPFGLPRLGPDPGIWQQPLQTFSTFGEATLEKPSPQEAFTDTGLIKRSMIPLQTQSRKNLRSYEGASAVYTSRAGCTRPKIVNGYITGIPPTSAMSHMMEDALITGNITWESPGGHTFLDGLSCGSAGSTCKLPFNCNVPYAYTDTDKPILPRQPTSLCVINTVGESFDPNAPVPSFMLVFNTDVDTDHWASLSLAGMVNNQTKFPLPKQGASGEWTVMNFGDRQFLNLTMCLLNSTLTLEHVSLNSTADSPEPEIQYYAGNNTWSTDAIVNMTDTTSNASYVSRGIMALNNWTDVSVDELNNMYAQSPNYNPSFINSTSVTNQFFEAVQNGINTNDFHVQRQAANFSVYVCGVCSALGDTDSAWQTHPYVSLIFHAVAARTGSMAQAIQATFFWLYQAQYSSAVPGFDMGDNSTMVFSAEASVPVGKTGIIVVGVLVLVNLVCVFAVTGMFLWRTHWSLYGNVWHAVAQLVAGPEIRPILEDATAATDGEVEGKLKYEGTKTTKVGLWDQGNGRLAVASGANLSQVTTWV
ncbi:hypothetical protein CFAM422_000002 [Trichoderma lentiforme]|uniref:Uncharacterized protein n=1 Tax=Trichoderma lentiforme TaxID=1567552 RepID=A0A9P4XR54_9HYPO|nr:hypothetical protein CFAM422_000002 [Trichoderma lentiforme]